MNTMEAVLFDLDGVLVDACDWHYEALNSALIAYGYPPIGRFDHLSIFNGLPTRIKLEMLNVAKADVDNINNKKQKYTLEIIKNNANIMSEKLELHEYLKSLNIKIACVTNSIRETAEEMLKSTGQFHYFDIIVANEDVNANKPYPDCYNYAIEKLGVNPINCLCVEDSPKGIQAATASLAGHLWIVSDTTQVNKQNYINFMEK